MMVRCARVSSFCPSNQPKLWATPNDAWKRYGDHGARPLSSSVGTTGAALRVHDAWIQNGSEC